MLWSYGVRNILDKIIFMSEDNRKWVLDRLSENEKHKLKIKLSENHNIKIVDNNIEEPSSDDNVIWRSECLNNTPSERIVGFLDKMPDVFVRIFLDYEGESARKFFVKTSKNVLLARYVAENSLLEYPNMHGETASKYLCAMVMSAP